MFPVLPGTSSHFPAPFWLEKGTPPETQKGTHPSSFNCHLTFGRLIAVLFRIKSNEILDNCLRWQPTAL